MWNFDTEERKEIIGSLAGQIKKCTKCSLSSRRVGVFPGEGPVNAKVMVIAEGPLSEKAEGLLNKTLDYIKVPKSKVFVTFVTKCKPPQPRAPKSTEIETCSSYLKYQLKVIEPKVIITLGKIPTEFMVGATEKKITEVIEENGCFLRSKDDWGFAVIPALHPSYLIQNKELIKPSADSLKQRIANALKGLKGEE